MLASDDPRSYRHQTNAHRGQANSPLDIPVHRWLKSRIRIVRDGIRTYVIPEVLVETGPKVVDAATGVPQATGEPKWAELYDRERRRPLRLTVLTGLPGGKGRLKRAVDVWKALFHARAFIPTVIEDSAVPQSS